MKSIRTYIALLLIAATVTGCAASAKAGNLMTGVLPNNVNGRPTDRAFADSMADYSIALFKKSIAKRENSLISPMSVMLALTMTANGAGGKTLAQMEKQLYSGIPLDELNEYLYSYITSLPSEENSTLSAANSIWLRDNMGSLQVEPEFLQKNADYYNAAVFKTTFDYQTTRDINNWAKASTGGMIKKVMDNVEKGAMLFLISTVTFDAEWARVYEEQDIVNNVGFTDKDGIVIYVDFMRSPESKYLNDGMAEGFIKPYIGGYSFAALLPNEGVSIDEYIETLTGEGFLDTLENAKEEEREIYLPKFEYEYKANMNEPLKALGVTNAFDIKKADFGKMAVSKEGNLFIGKVIHNTFIKVDERGTKAGAATTVEMDSESVKSEPEKMLFNRPFVYAIIDDATNLPVLIGTVVTI